MQGKRLLLAIAAISGFATPAFAVMMSVPMGWYLEANAGSGHLSNFNYQGSTSSSGIGGNANLGYKFMPYFSLEVGYSRYPNTSIKVDDDSIASVKHYSYDIAARGIWPIADSGFELFAKLGAQRIKATVSVTDEVTAAALDIGSGSHSSTGLYSGVGGQFYFMPELAVVVQWQRALGSSSTGTEDLYSGGISFLFA